MLKIEAIVRPERIHSVTDALEQAGCGGFHYLNVTGQGKQRGVEVFTGRGAQMVRAAGSKTLVVTIIPDDLKDAAVNAIVEAARSPDGGRIGDGKIISNPRRRRHPSPHRRTRRSRHLATPRSDPHTPPPPVTNHRTGDPRGRPSPLPPLPFAGESLPRTRYGGWGEGKRPGRQASSLPPFTCTCPTRH